MQELRNVFVAGVATPLSLSLPMRCELVAASAKQLEPSHRKSLATGRHGTAQAGVLERSVTAVPDCMTHAEGYRVPMGVLYEQRNALATRWTLILSSWVEAGLALRTANALYVDGVTRDQRSREICVSLTQLAVSLHHARRSETAVAAATFSVERGRDTPETRDVFWDTYITPYVAETSSLEAETASYWAAWWEANIRGPVLAKSPIGPLRRERGHDMTTGD